MSQVPEEAQAVHTCQVLVIGSGVSGYCAAIQAGRCGCETVLVEKDEVLGGNSGPNLGVGITGAERYNDYGVETGLLQELREEGCWVDAPTHTGRGSMGYSISRRFEAVVQSYLEAAGVRVLKRHYARKPLLEGDRIVGVLAEDLGAFRPVRIEVSGLVIEASGDGEIGALAGADFDLGSEGRDEFGERSAPDQRTDYVQGTSLVAIAHRTDHEVLFVPPPGTPEHTPRVWHGRMSSWLHHHGGWLARPSGLMFLYVTETGGNRDTIRDDAAIYEDLLKQLWAEWDHIKNGPHREEALCWDLLWVSPKAGKRESRRFLGDYVLTQSDVEEGRRFEDDIAYGGHDLDDHMPLSEGSNIFAHSIPPLYGIPFRCCYSRNVSNLLLAGRLISATHLAHASTRIMGTGGAIGQALGIAAALCLEHSCTPRELGRQHIAELQEELLDRDGTILCRPSRGEGDLARRARATASSELRLNDQTPGAFVPLLAPAGVVLWDWPARLDRAEAFLRNDSGSDQELVLTVARARRERKWLVPDEYHQFRWNDLRDEAFTPLHSAGAVLPAGFEGWFAFDLGGVEVGEKDAASDGDRLLVWMAPAGQVRDGLPVNGDPPRVITVSWAMAERPWLLAEAVEHSYHLPTWRGMGCMGTLRLTPAPALGEAANAVNGFHRRFSRGPTNLWMSDPADGLPQDLVLRWDEDQTFDRVGLTFDTLYPRMEDHPWHTGARVAEMLVADYELSVLEPGREGSARGPDDAWRRILAVAGNYRRCRSHDFEATTTRALRLRVLRVHGEGQGARVYSVRVGRAGN